MSRHNHLFQETVNKLLDFISENCEIGTLVPSDTEIASRFDISRSTARKAITHLEGLGVLVKDGRKRKLEEKPEHKHYFDLQQLGTSKDEQIEDFFMHRILSGQLHPGDRFSELELSRESGCSTVSVREFLIRFSRFGLIEKNPRSQWQMKTFDEPFVDELYEVRHLFEMHSLSRFMTLPSDSEHWSELEQLLEDHKRLKEEFAVRFNEFSDLDQRFHRLLQKGQPNQFVSQFYDIISFVFHYHYQWDMGDAKARNINAIDEHIEIITNMLMGDIRAATSSLDKHLNTTKKTLKQTAIYRNH